MDDHGASRTVVPDTRNVLLPSWTDDGKKIAFVEKSGKKFDIFVTDLK